MRRLCWIWVFGCWFFWSCGAGSGQGGPDAADWSDGSALGKENPQENPSENAGEQAGASPNIELKIPASTRVCGVFMDDRSIQDEMALLCEVALKPMTKKLPVNLDVFELDWIQSVTFGADRIQATGQGAGECSYEFSEVSGYVTHAYQCTQSFQVEGTQFTLAYPLKITFMPGQEQKKQVVIDENYLKGPVMEGFLGQGQDYRTEMIQLASCSYEALDLYLITLDWGNGDQLVLHQRGADPRGADFPAGSLLSIGYTGATRPTNLVKAQMRINGENREVSDYFGLVYASVHHNWFEKYLVILDPPMGEVHGLYCEDIGENGREPPGELLYLGEDLDVKNPVRRTTLSSSSIELTLEP